MPFSSSENPGDIRPRQGHEAFLIISSLQTLRFFASLSVLQYHLWANYLGVAFGHPGTDFFLVLVGFVAAVTQAKRILRDGWRAYLKGRYIRLYVTFVPLFLIALLGKWQGMTWDWVVRSFFFVPIADRFPVIGATWMLSMFVLFYFVFSLAFLFRTETILWPIFCLWAVFIALYSWADWNADLPAHWSRLLLNERNLDFILGYLAGVIFRGKRMSVKWAGWIFVLGGVGVIGGTAVLNTITSHVGRSLFIGVPVTLFVLGLAMLERQGTTNRLVQMLTTPWLVWLGGTSYVLYISHGIYLQAWSRVLPVQPILVPAITIGAILTGAIGYLVWEEPILRYAKKRVWIKPQIPQISRQKQSRPATVQPQYMGTPE